MTPGHAAAAPRLALYLDLIRWDRPAGWLLLLWPTLSALWIAADGFPGIPGWGEKSAAAVLAKYEHLEAIPADPQTWGLSASRAARLAESLAALCRPNLE